MFSTFTLLLEFRNGRSKNELKLFYDDINGDNYEKTL